MSAIMTVALILKSTEKGNYFLEIYISTRGMKVAH